MDFSKIMGVTSNSKKVKQGFLFAAIKGLKVDGFDFLESALKAGATVVMVQNDLTDDQKQQLLKFQKNYVFDLIESSNIRRDFSNVCADFYMKQPPHIVAVTGTDGKTSVAEFSRQIFDALGLKSASIGTLGVSSDYIDIQSSHTTPPPEDLYRILSDMTDVGIDAVAMEASSQGIAQHRLSDVGIMAAGFTTFTEEHIQEHGTMERYFNEKAKLFKVLLISGGVAVLNADIPEYPVLRSICDDRGIYVLGYGRQQSDFQIMKQELTDDGQVLDLNLFGKKYTVKLNLIGEFQAMNVLCALGMVLGTLYSDQIKAQDFSFFHKLIETDILKILENLTTVNGRMDFVARTKKGAHVFIDYAHTGDAVEKVLKTLRPHTKGKLICVFGCGGNRDASKRLTMGRAAEIFSDVPIITDDNPRDEDPAAIRDQVQSACPSGLNIADRRLAIQKAIELAEQGDLIVVAGKGHETGQVVKGKTIPYSDRETILELLL